MMSFKSIPRLLFVLSFVLLIPLSGCGGSRVSNTDTATNTSRSTVVVTGFAGPFISGTATAFKIVAGQKSEQLAVARFDSKGCAMADITRIFPNLANFETVLGNVKSAYLNVLFAA